MKQFQMGFSMVICMAAMVAINVGVMVYKSVKTSRRQSRLKELKKIRLEAALAAAEKEKIAKTFDIKNGMKEAVKQWKLSNNWEERQAKK